MMNGSMELAINSSINELIMNGIGDQLVIKISMKFMKNGSMIPLMKQMNAKNNKQMHHYRNPTLFRFSFNSFQNVLQYL